MSSFQESEVIYRHSRLVRVTHWLNALAVVGLLFTGLVWTQAYTPLHWGDAGQELHGATETHKSIAVVPGVFPWSRLREEVRTGREGLDLGATFDAVVWEFKDYLISVRVVRDHILFAWLLFFSGVTYLVAGFFSGRFRSILRPSWRDIRWRELLSDLSNHLRLRFPKGEEARSYNLIQKYAYLFIIFSALPLQWLSGMVLLPWMDGAFPVLKELFLGRQSARTIHFFGALVILGFLLVHVAMVVVSGFRNNMRSMISGWYKLPR
jgi:thiosulfate reductase cytochrome b subunit